MMAPTSIGDFWMLAGMAVAGIGFGLLYFAAVRTTAARLTGGGSRLVPVLLTLGRIGAAVALFGFAAMLGAFALLAAFGGFLVARTIALRAQGARR